MYNATMVHNHQFTNHEVAMVQSQQPHKPKVNYLPGDCGNKIGKDDPKKCIFSTKLSMDDDDLKAIFPILKNLLL